LFKLLLSLQGSFVLLFCQAVWAQPPGQAAVVQLSIVEAVNRQVNRMVYGTDQQVWGQRDYWASPQEFFQRGMGDCEDFVLAKYHQLIRQGIAAQQLSLAYVKRAEDYASHMVLLYEEQGRYWVLDNFQQALEQVDARSDLLPVYRFNLESGDAEFLTSSWQVLRRSPAAMQRVDAWRRYIGAIALPEKV
jgi:predicted transglutaminase-like cysteine proteinase